MNDSFQQRDFYFFMIHENLENQWTKLWLYELLNNYLNSEFLGIKTV